MQNLEMTYHYQGKTAAFARLELSDEWLEEDSFVTVSTDAPRRGGETFEAGNRPAVVPSAASPAHYSVGPPEATGPVADLQGSVPPARPATLGELLRRALTVGQSPGR